MSRASGDVALHLNLQQLEDTAALGRALISGLPGAGLLILDADLRILLADGDAHQRVDADIHGRLVWDVLPATAWEELEPRYRAALAGELQTFDFEAATSDTEHAVRIAPIRDGANVIGVMVLTQDITARVTAARQLADSERLQRSVLEVLDEGVIVVGLDGALVQANHTACETLGVELATALADPSWWEPVRARRADAGPDAGATVMKTGQEVRDVALEIARPDGTIVSLSANYHALKDETGGITGLVISFRDTTGRDDVHRSLVASQEHLREAHELARLSSWEWRPETNAVFAFHANASEDEVLVHVSTPLEDVLAAIPENAREIAREDLASIARGERDTAVQRHHYAYETGPVWIETRLRAVRADDGELFCVRGTSQDVTEQELAKQEVITQAALLEQVDVAVIATDPGGLDHALEPRRAAAAWLDPRRDGGAQRRGVPGPDRRARRRRGGPRARPHRALGGRVLRPPQGRFRVCRLSARPGHAQRRGSAHRLDRRVGRPDQARWSPSARCAPRATICARSPTAWATACSRSTPRDM